MFRYNHITNLIISLFFSIIITLLIYNKLIYPTIIPIIQEGTLIIFRDWQIIVISNICDGKGFDVYVENPCDYWKSRHVYGKILLNLPLVENNLFFYFIFLPIILNIILIYQITSFFLIKKKISNFFYLSAYVFSASFILAVERANIDIVIFLIIILLAKYKNLLLNYLLIISSSMAKFYPIVLISIFLFSKSIKKISINIFASAFIILTLLFIQKESLIKIINNKSQFSSFGIYEFSVFGFLESLNQNNYYLFIVLAFFCFLFAIYKINYSLKESNKIFFILNNDEFDNRLFFLSSIIIISCYLTFSNFIYREIFLLGLIPYLINNLNNNENDRNIKYFFYFLTLKFTLSTVLIFIEKNRILPIYDNFIILTKHTIDLFLMIVLIYFCFVNLVLFFKNKFFYIKK